MFIRPGLPRLLPLVASLALLPAAAAAQQAAPGWQACAALPDAADRLACFDRWAAQQAAPTHAASAPASAWEAPVAVEEPPAPPVRSAAGTRIGLRLTTAEGCRDPRFSTLTRYWELEPGADCGTFGLRVYRPMSIGVVTADTVNRQPVSFNPDNVATSRIDYRTTELRLQLSVRTKLAKGLLVDRPDAIDSLWFGYTQQSYWQLFTPELSRPFRSTDHEPELVYVAPIQSAAPGRLRLRYGGLGVVHQSNGQSLPLSRSWNRAYLMAGATYGRLQLHGRVWQRLPEGGPDDNPRIGDFIGRAELRAVWQADDDNAFVLTRRHSLRSEGRGAWRLEWFRTLDTRGGLQLHAQLFSGYGDTLLDYNRRRTFVGVGLSLVEW